MKNRIKRIIISAILPLVLAGIIFGSTAMTALADAPYKTYTVDGYGSVTETQTAYLPYKTITKIGEETLLTPTDFTIVNDEYIYILDSGNARVVVSDMDNELVMTFGEGILTAPKGIYVTKDYKTYVADRDAKAVFVFDKEGNLTETYTKPTEAMFGVAQDFLTL